MTGELLVGEGGGRYLVGALLAHGGQAEVYTAVDTTDGRELVVKVALAPGVDSELVRAGGLRMAELAADPVLGPLVVPVWDVGGWGDRAWVVMERMERTLSEVDRLDGVIAALAHAVTALEAAGVPHGDLKPSNVFVVEDEGRVRVLLGDLWAGRGPAPLSPGFAAPERWAGEAPSRASDRFALSATVWAWWTGHPPPCALDAARGGRPPTPEELASLPAMHRAALGALLHPLPTRRPPPWILTRAARAGSHRPWALLALAAALLVRGPAEAPPCPSPFVAGGGGCVAPDGRAVVWVPPGRLQMGGSGPDAARWAPDAPRRVVSLTRGLWVRTTEVTQDEAFELLGSWPVAEREERLPDGTLHTCASWEGHSTVGGRLPAACLSWFDAIALANAASDRDGLPRAYMVTPDEEGGEPRVHWDVDSPGWRLPTEAEWEWAAAEPWAGALERDAICAFANVRDVSAPEAWGGEVPCSDGAPVLAPVGAFAPNGRGLFDMVGNVAEWVWDRYHDVDPRPVVDPRGPEVGGLRGLRGGGWNQIARPIYARFGAFPSDLGLNGGVRLVRSPGGR